MNYVINEDEIVLNTCSHQQNKSQQYQKYDVNFTDANILNQNLNVCQITNSNVGENESSNKIFSNYHLSPSTDYNLGQGDLLRDIYLNQIILPQQDLNKYEVKIFNY